MTALTMTSHAADLVAQARQFAGNISERVREAQSAQPETLNPFLDAAYYSAMMAYTYANDADKQADHIFRLRSAAASNDDFAATLPNPERAAEYRKAAANQRDMCEVHQDLTHQAYIKCCRACDVADQMVAAAATWQAPNIL